MPRSPVLLALLFLSAPAYADGFENVPLGARTAALGGTGLARGRDAAMPVLNPAGLALVPSSVLSLSASVYGAHLARIPGFVSDGAMVAMSGFDANPLSFSVAGDEGLSATDYETLPSGIAYFLHLGGAERPTTLAASLSVPKNVNRTFTGSFDFEEQVADRTQQAPIVIEENLSFTWQERTYLGALSWASGFGALRVGASLLLAYSTFLELQNDGTLLYLGNAPLFRRYDARLSHKGTSFDLAVLAGAQLDLGDSFSIGLGVRSPSLHLGGSWQGYLETVKAGPLSDPDTTTLIEETGDFVSGIPLRIGAGLELRGARWAFALDGTIYLPRSAERANDATGAELRRVDFKDFDICGTPNGRVGPNGECDETTLTNLSGEVAEEQAVAFTASAGFEYAFESDKKIQLGAFVETSAEVLRLDPAGLFRLPLARVGGAAGFSTPLGAVETTIGVKAAFGSGDTARSVPATRFTALAYEATAASVVDVSVFLTAAADITELVGDAKEQD